MKNTLKLFVLVLLSGIILFTGCKKKDDTVPPPNAEENLVRTWVPESNVTYDGAVDTRFSGFEVTFTSNGNYTSVNGFPVFRSNGTWAFNANNTAIILDGNTQFTINTLNQNNLNGTVNLEGGANARTTGIDGVYVFNLKPKS